MANTNDWGLTPEGFRRPSYSEILDGFEYQTREKFTKDGKAPNLTVRSPLGIFIRIWAWIVNLLFQLLEDVYNSQFVDTAVGSSLYQLGRNIGLSLLPAQRSSGHIIVRGPPGLEIPAGYLVGTVAGIQYAVQLAGVISEEGIVTVPAQCTEFGDIGNTSANTVTEVINPIENETVTNLSPFTGGRSRETDSQFRDRYYKSVDFAGGVNADAIGAEILQTVEGVLSAKVYENDTDSTDSRGLPQHSLEAVVFAGLDYEVAQAIYRRKSAGIQTYGSSMVEIISPQNGQVYQIHFTRPAGKPIWIRLNNVQVNKAAFPSDGADQLKKVLTSYIGDDVSSGLSIGDNVIYNMLPGLMYQVSGVIDFNMTVSIDGIAYNQNNIIIGEREKAVTSDDKISILFSESEEV